MKKEIKFKNAVKTILISHYDQQKFKEIVDMMFDEVYGKDKR